MFTQDEIDNVLRDAQDAVAELAAATGADTHDPIAPPQTPTLTASKPASPALARSAPPAKASAATIERVLRMRIPLIVRLANRRMCLLDIMQLNAGSILEFDHHVEAELELLANNKCIGTGEAVKVGENFGLKVRYIGDVRQRLASIAGTRPTIS